MRIIVVADTHKDYHKYKKIVEDNLNADLFIHLGDGEHEFNDVQELYPQKKFVFVKGNTDFTPAKEVKIVTVGGYKIFCTHGHKYNIHDGLEKFLGSAKAEDCKIALYGHTHLYRTEFIDGIYVMNPGSVDSPRGKNLPSYGTIDISPKGTITMNIVAFKG